MGNMSYCRFENTFRDLEDCAENITATDLNESEARYRERLVETCKDILEELGHNVELNGSIIPVICSVCKSPISDLEIENWRNSNNVPSNINPDCCDECAEAEDAKERRRR